MPPKLDIEWESSSTRMRRLNLVAAAQKLRDLRTMEVGTKIVSWAATTQNLVW